MFIFLQMYSRVSVSMSDGFSKNYCRDHPGEGMSVMGINEASCQCNHLSINKR